MDREKLGVKLRQIIGDIDTNGKLEEIADYILDNFVAKEDVERDYVYMGGTHNPCAKQEPQTKVYAIASDFERLKELEKSGKPQDSKPMECDPLECDPYRDCPDRTDLLIVKPYKPKPALPDVPEKFPDHVYTDPSWMTCTINDLIDCYSALKKIVEEKL
jgi:hypothetical protein